MLLVASVQWLIFSPICICSRLVFKSHNIVFVILKQLINSLSGFWSAVIFLILRIMMSFIPIASLLARSTLISFSLHSVVDLRRQVIVLIILQLRLSIWWVNSLIAPGVPAVHIMGTWSILRPSFNFSGRPAARLIVFLAILGYIPLTTRPISMSILVVWVVDTILIDEFLLDLFVSVVDLYLSLFLWLCIT